MDRGGREPARVESVEKASAAGEPKEMLRPAAWGREHRHTAGERLGCDDSEAFLQRGHDEQRRRTKLVCDVCNLTPALDSARQPTIRGAADEREPRGRDSLEDSRPRLEEEVE